MNTGDKIIISAVFLVVLAVVIGGFWIGGSPFLLKAQKIDQTRVSSLFYISNAINSYGYQHSELPATLDDLTPKLTDQNLKDPETGVPYEYKATASTTYQLCATFGAATPDNGNSYYPVTNKHKAGYDCLSYTVNFPQLYKPPPIIPQPLLMSGFSPTCTVHLDQIQTSTMSGGFWGGFTGTASVTSSTKSVCLWWTDNVPNFPSSRKSYMIFRGTSPNRVSMTPLSSVSGGTAFLDPAPPKGYVCYGLDAIYMEGTSGKAIPFQAACF